MSDFDWYAEDENLVVRPSSATVLYKNNAGDVVIRQQGDWPNGEDQIIVIPSDRLHILIQALQNA